MARTSKPNCISVIPMPIRMGGVSWMSYGMTVGFDLTQPEVLVAEADVWQSIPEELPHIGSLDTGAAKGQGEWLLAGKTYSPSRHAGSMSWEPRVSLGQLQKQIRVHGPRAWDGQQIVNKQICQSVNMEWTLSYGGVDDPNNLKGCGRQMPDKTLTVPQIELPSAPWNGPDQNCESACTLPLDFQHPSKKAYGGTYDASYLEKFYPGMPSDFDRRYFNLAPLDQRLNGFWVGNESFELTQWHCDHPIIKGQLPGLRASFWVGEEVGPLKPLNMVLSTVWFFPNALMGVLVFHGLQVVKSLHGQEIVKVLAGLERLVDTPLGPDHYEQIWQQRTAHTPEAAAGALNDTLLYPDGFRTRFMALDSALANYRINPALKKMDLLIDQKSKELFTSLEQLQKEFPNEDNSEMVARLKNLNLQRRPKIENLHPLSRLSALFESQKTLMENMERQASENLEWIRKKIPAQSANAMNKIKAEADLHDRGWAATQNLDQLRNLIKTIPNDSSIDDEQLLTTALKNVDMLERTLNSSNEKLDEKLKKSNQTTQAYAELLGVSSKNTIPNEQDLERIQKQWMREQKLPHFKALDPVNLTDGNQLWASHQRLEQVSDSNLNLSGRDLSGLVIEKTTVTASDFSRVLFDKANFIECTFVGCDFKGIKALGLHIEKCLFQWCRFDEMQVSQSTWMGNQIMGSSAVNSIFDQSEMNFCTWMSGDMQGSSWKNTRFKHCTSHEIDYTNCDFSNTYAEKSTWSRCQFEMSNWQSAQLKRCVLPMGQLPKLWQGANLSQVSFHGVHLDGGQWQNCSFDAVDFSQADLRNSCFEGIQAKNLQMQNTNLKNCDFSKSQIDHGLFMESDLRGCSFLHARLSHCWLGQSLQDEATLFHGVDLSSCSLHPVREDAKV